MKRLFDLLERLVALRELEADVRREHDRLRVLDWQRTEVEWAFGVLSKMNPDGAWFKNERDALGVALCERLRRLAAERVERALTQLVK